MTIELLFCHTEGTTRTRSGEAASQAARNKIRGLDDLVDAGLLGEKRDGIYVATEPTPHRRSLCLVDNRHTFDLSYVE